MAKKKASVMIWYPLTIPVSKVAFKDDAVYYKKVGTSSIDSVPYSQFMQAIETDEGYSLMIKVKYKVGEFVATSIDNHANPNLVVCKREHGHKIIVNVSSLKVTSL